MEHSFVLKRRVAFHETDMAGLAHFSNFFRWMEEAEHGFLDSIGLAPVVKDRATFWGWPRSKASCDYKEPLRFGDAFDCELVVKQIKMKSVVYRFRFTRSDDSAANRLIAKGEMTSVYAKFDVEKDTMFALDLSEELLSRIEEMPGAAVVGSA